MILIIASLIISSFFELNFLVNNFQQHPIFVLILGLAFYFFPSFIVLHFNASLITCLIHRLQGERISIFTAMRLTLQKTSALLQWTFVSATICVILNALEQAHSLVADIIYAIFGFSWSVTTYFVLPIMIAENVGPIQAFKRSIQLIGKGWRKFLSVNFILFLIIAGLVALVYSVSIFFNQFQLNMAITIPLILFLVVMWFIISKTFNSIFNSALYLTINNKNLQGFDEEILSKFMVKK
ncbi:DUF6159 family protein [Legionella hackeliae]|uniref:Uncharacterized protein n=1 Tax=Legionella hackeliae TaxID=449 RepID=A0A0A8URL2_LEGHA|nr:DUF6159 family protein [Legionella hackeliae]KTD10226.1 hypothetical protein Lhac_2594 [Legionella hackeliae]CEK09722.1 conserved membrane protein of unknown function [Legionella hackeliae]STX49631.1 Uncharacterised protein [Legionella hackeliae]